jgi:hypothetical protein
MERRAPAPRAARNGFRFTAMCALDHNHECCESQTVRNLLVKIVRIVARKALLVTVTNQHNSMNLHSAV